MNQLPVYAVYTQSHEALVREFFLPSLPGDVDLRLSMFDVDGPGDFLDEGFIRTIRHKLDLIIKSVDQNEGEVIVWADVDIQFFDSFVEPVQKLTSTFDFCCQTETFVNGDVNTGFIALRCNGDTRYFFERVRAMVIESGRNEQPVVNELIDTGQTEGLSIGRFSQPFYAATHGPPPEHIVLHHANDTAPEPHKSSLQRKLEQLHRVRSLRGHSLEPCHGPITHSNEGIR